MQQLGFPADAQRVVKDIYTGAQTRVRGKGNALSESIHITSGTIPGDSLSPLLFLIYVEPLLPWLKHRGVGYQLGCLPKRLQQRHTLAGHGFIDELVCYARTAEQLNLQARKVQLFEAHALIKPNASKRAATGILHGSGTVDYAANAKRVKQLVEGRIWLGPKAVPFLPPDSSYRYLGWETTLTLDRSALKK